ncbi:hypothetical protein M407DRAFT_33896 [Tulasnella calospora MUT 4182]|uniref:Uncharacterized protein n=1 Tax=Tulasnella calospora MUT 4182 TaxID=1051891 RepID=A0A0C3PPN4_9AGAM|nr:hypothetical protein M407DRAFT_33896 [Tulasnella calospora MUT 4182]
MEMGSKDSKLDSLLHALSSIQSGLTNPNLDRSNPEIKLAIDALAVICETFRPLFEDHAGDAATGQANTEARQESPRLDPAASAKDVAMGGKAVAPTRPPSPDGRKPTDHASPVLIDQATEVATEVEAYQSEFVTSRRGDALKHSSSAWTTYVKVTLTWACVKVTLTWACVNHPGGLHVRATISHEQLQKRVPELWTTAFGVYEEIEKDFEGSTPEDMKRLAESLITACQSSKDQSQVGELTEEFKAWLTDMVVGNTTTTMPASQETMPTPTWGGARQQLAFQDSNWDRLTGSIVKDPSEPTEKVIQVPAQEAWVVTGVCDLHAEMCRLADETRDRYHENAAYYIRAVLNTFFRPYLDGEEETFKVITKSLGIVWKASDYGNDVTHLCHGAQCRQGSVKSVNDWGPTTPQPKGFLQQKCPKLPEMFNDVLDAVKSHIKLPVPDDQEGNETVDGTGPQEGEDVEMADLEQPIQPLQLLQEPQMQGNVQKRPAEEEDEWARKRRRIQQEDEKGSTGLQGGEEDASRIEASVYFLRHQVCKQMRLLEEGRSTKVDLDLVTTIKLYLEWTKNSKWFIERMRLALQTILTTEAVVDPDPAQSQSHKSIELSIPNLIAILKNILEN